MSVFRKIKLITFDVTNTLLKFRRSQGQQYGEIGAMFGVLRDNNQLFENFKTNWFRMNQEHPNFGLNTGMDWRKWWMQVVYDTFQDQFGDSIEEKKLEAIANHLIDSYQTSACWEQCYGSAELLQYFKDNNRTMGIVSNFDRRLETLLNNMHIRDKFEFVLNSYDAGIEKPNRAIFDMALDAGKRVVSGLKADQALHIGDTPKLDYLGARAAGWHAILIHEREPEELQEKYPGLEGRHVFRSLYDVHRHIVNDTIKL